MTEEFKLKIGEKELIVNIKNLAEQSNGSCLFRSGDTLVLATAVIASSERDGIDYFPLMVGYEERYYAAGKILGSRYVRRESRPSDEAVLTARLIDRAIRPLFNQNSRRDVQLVITCLSWDRENDPDIIGLLSASLSLLISDIPWAGPVAGLRIGRKDGQFILNPTYVERIESDLDLTISATEENGEILINMIESESKEVEEKIILEAVEWAKPYLKQLIDFQKKIAKEIGKEKIILTPPDSKPELDQEARKLVLAKLEKAIFVENKQEKSKNSNNLFEEVLELLKQKDPDNFKSKIGLLKQFIEEETVSLMREKILKREQRLDGRKIDELREVSVETGILPRTHGSGLFCRGLTKTLSILTLGAPDDVKLLAGMEFIGEKRFMHHYNFPPYSTGEVSPMRGPGRREIGHGMLAEKALTAVMPNPEEFPYTIRVVSEVLSSNGSSSMASTCSSTIALMDAGVPISAPVAGIAMGLIKDNDDYKILTDIQGPEDHCGDMDLKVAGTNKGITALQMDLKITGITTKILSEGLEQAKKARIKILDKITQIIPQPRAQLSQFAPRIITIQINPEKIGDVIGKGGKVINEIIKECGVLIDIEESGTVFITAETQEGAQKAVDWIKNLTREIMVGEVFDGKVVKILDFGAFVEILPGQEGMIHISKLSSQRVEKVTDVVNVGDKVRVKVIAIDDQSRINLCLEELIKN
ncbi:MAG: polyribonucleotide nucleotidyltransferase [Patescibacteria group bacterium]|nr:polyribonucleotide nucleotidyltransferase [Patescibacteria group bacterium]MBU1876919.1 polyribonucleotide nucleotidyltransferase [Patescibacteria group bacterium]